MQLKLVQTGLQMLLIVISNISMSISQVFKEESLDLVKEIFRHLSIKRRKSMNNSWSIFIMTKYYLLVKLQIPQIFCGKI